MLTNVSDISYCVAPVGVKQSVDLTANKYDIACATFLQLNPAVKIKLNFGTKPIHAEQ